MTLPAKQVSALLVTVNYKSESSTLALLASLERLNGFSSLEVILVDNCSGEGSLERLRTAIAPLSNVELIESATNLGYFGAAKLACDHYLAQGHGLPNWIIVCNHDVVIEDRDFLDKLCARDPDSCGVAAPRITVSDTGIEQNPFMARRPSLWRRSTMRFYSSWYPCAVIWDWLSRVKQHSRSLMRGKSSIRKFDEHGRSIYAGHGAFLIFSRKFFQAGGYLDDSLFLFGEEIATAEICRSLNLPVIYDPSLQVLHDEHQSVGVGMSRTAYSYHRRAVRHVFSKYLTS